MLRDDTAARIFVSFSLPPSSDAENSYMGEEVPTSIHKHRHSFLVAGVWRL